MVEAQANRIIACYIGFRRTPQKGVAGADGETHHVPLALTSTTRVVANVHLLNILNRTVVRRARY